MPQNTEKKRYNVGGVMLDRPFKAGRLGHIGIYATRMDESIHFYSDLLGFRITDQLVPKIPEGAMPGGPGKSGGPSGGKPDPKAMQLTFLSYGTDHHAMVLVPSMFGMMGDPAYERGVTINQLSFQVGTLEEMVNAHTMLREKEADIWRVCRDVPGSNWAVYFRDPDGHTCELYYGMEQIGWEGRSKPLPAFFEYGSEKAPELPRMAEREEIAAVEKTGVPLNSGYRPLDTLPANYNVGGVMLPRPFKIVRTGAISLFVADVDVSERFYVQEMGFTVTEEVIYQGHRAVFLRSGTAEHHTLALVPLALRLSLGFSERTTVMTYGIQVGSYRQLQDAVKFLEGHGCKQSHVPAELHPGIDYAAHFTDPEGHCIQLYYYMEQVGWDGKPRPADQRRRAVTPWPDVLESMTDTYADRTFQGPLG